MQLSSNLDSKGPNCEKKRFDDQINFLKKIFTITFHSELCKL